MYSQMKHLIIIGARGCGRCVYSIAKSMDSYNREFDIKGFLDDKSDALSEYQNYPPILDSVESYIIQKDDVFICALGDVFYKEKYTEIILNKGGEFLSVIHPTACINQNVHIGKGCVVACGVMLDSDVEVNDFVCIQAYAVIGHDVKVGKWSILDCQTFVGGFTTIGERVTVHTGTKIIPNIHIADHATINAGSIVIRNVKKDSVVMGNPAREMIIPKK